MEAIIFPTTPALASFPPASFPDELVWSGGAGGPSGGCGGGGCGGGGLPCLAGMYACCITDNCGKLAPKTGCTFCAGAAPACGLGDPYVGDTCAAAAGFTCAGTPGAEMPAIAASGLAATGAGVTAATDAPEASACAVWTTADRGANRGVNGTLSGGVEATAAGLDAGGLGPGGLGHAVDCFTDDAGAGFAASALGKRGGPAPCCDVL